MTFTILVSFCAFLLSLLGTRIIILAMRQRRSQLGYDKLPLGVPGAPPYAIQNGGVVVTFAVLICMGVIDLRFGVLLSTLLLLSLALLKKILPVPWLVQVVMQIMAIAVTMSSVAEPTFGGVLAPWLDILITGALWLWFIHVFASMDRLDGLCSSALLSIGLGIALLSTIAGQFPDTLSSDSLIVLAAGFGFFWWNRTPAKISMGEVGTLPLGFLLGYLFFTAVHEGYGLSLLIIPAYFMSDHALSWVRRTWKNQPMVRDHNEYYYMLAQDNGRRPRFVLRSIIGINIIMVFLTSHAQIEPDLVAFHLLLAYISVFMLLGVFAHEKAEKTDESKTDGR